MTMMKQIFVWLIEDINLIEKIMNVVDIPITVVGGAGTLSDIEELFGQFGLIGACAGSLFVFKGKL